MMKIAVLNGPNLNLLGEREKEIYGGKSLQDINEILVEKFPELEFTFFQSNSEGEIIDEIHNAGKFSDAIVINPAAYSHYSIAIRDAIASISIPAVEVHISNIYKREDFRKTSVTGAVCKGVISGFGEFSYTMAVHYLEQI